MAHDLRQCSSPWWENHGCRPVFVVIIARDSGTPPPVLVWDSRSCDGSRHIKRVGPGFHLNLSRNPHQQTPKGLLGDSKPVKFHWNLLFQGLLEPIVALF